MDKIQQLYSIENQDLERLFLIVTNYIKEQEGYVELRDLSLVIESKPTKFENSTFTGDQSSHHETAISDSQGIYLHDNLAEVGGVSGRLYDLIHLGLGHFWQWNSDCHSNFSFYGKEAWDVGSSFFLGADDVGLKIAKVYELEAARIALSILRDILGSRTCFSTERKKSIIAFYNDYLYSDLVYIIAYYKSGVELPFSNCWKFNSVSLKPIRCPAQIRTEKRFNKCIPLINIRT